MIYTNVLSAVVAALAAEAIDNTSTQAWQKLYRAGHQDGLDLAVLMRSGGERLNRGEVNCWVHARLHSGLIPRHWHALLARFSTHRGRKVDAIGRLVPLVASPAPRLFVAKAVTAWAVPLMKGVDGKRSSDVIVLPREFYDMNAWDLDANPERTRRRWRAGVFAVLDEMCGEALVAAGEILKAEGVLLDVAA